MLWPFKKGSKLDLTLELPPEERRFLDLLAPTGLNWKTTRAQFEARYGNTMYHDWAKVVALPPTKVLSKTPLVFNMYWNSQFDDLPPEYLFADYMPFRDARKNHAQMEAEIQGVLGEGERCDVSNCLKRKWSIGIFSVEILTWPPELQSNLRNTLIEKNSDLAFNSSIQIKSELSHIFPYKELLFLVDLINGKNDSNSKLQRLGVQSNHFPNFHHLRYTYRNPAELKRAMNGAWPVAWINYSESKVGITGVERSLVMPFDRGNARLINYKIAPARGCGGSELLVQHGSSPDPRDFFKYSTKIFHSSDLDGMDDISRSLSKFWDIECVVEHGFDD